MRLRSDIFVSALIRRTFGLGGFAAIERKGADAAGAIFIRQRFRDGLETLFGPAPQSLAMDKDDDPGESGARRFEIRLARAEAEAVDAVIARELKWDSDLWLLELEIDEIGDLLPVVSDD